MIQLSEMLNSIVIFIAFLLTTSVVYHLLTDEDDPKKLEKESFELQRDWEEICSRF